MDTTLATRRLVLVGFRPEDISFQSLLIDDFRADITRGVSHFWLCPAPNVEARQLAPLYDIQLIEYTPEDDNHSDITKILSILSKFVPREPEPGTVYEGVEIDVSDLPVDDELRKFPVEDIRRRLNAAIKGLSKKAQDREDYLRLANQFFRDYSLSLHTAWHVQEGSVYEVIWGTKVERRLGGGAFGGVWLAKESVDGQEIAIKILNETILHETGFLEAFERGVRAMRILSEKHVRGMVRYIRAFDVPACVVMEYVDGINLEDVTKGNMVESMSRALWIIKRVADIVYSGHELDKHVLHRDLKPSNVMLRHLRDQEQSPEVLVLDFDLSWYEGALGQSMIAGALNNYISPEQLITREPNVSSRHAAVDVFGLGMLLYFVCTKTPPALNVQNDKGFENSLLEKIREAWRCRVPGIERYLAHTIVYATYTKQDRRCGMPALIDRVEVMRKILEEAQYPVPSGIAILAVAEFLLEAGWHCQIDVNKLSSIRLTKSNVATTLRFVDEEDDQFEVILEYAPTEIVPRGLGKKKYLESHIEKAESKPL